MNKVSATIIVNLFGQPCAGKSTLRAKVFSMLKECGVNCEEVYEHAKKLTWANRNRELACQPYILGKQLRDLEVLQGQVDVIITDCPLLLGYYYARKYCGTRYPESFYTYCTDQFRQMGGLNYFLRRVNAYDATGRNQTEEEADMIGLEMRSLLTSLKVPVKDLDADGFAAQIIVDDVMRALNIVKKSRSLFESEPKALHAPGTIYKHYKGGVYRINHVDENDIVHYEHLWPHEHGYHEKPISEFRDNVNTPEYKGPRFKFIRGSRL